jgi:DNA-binding transcriptional LysR family regulator
VDPRRLGMVSGRLQHFQAIVQEGSIRGAAQALNIAPSSVSRHLRNLEDDLGMPLFERVGKRIKLTSAGETLIYHARASVRELAHACALLQDLQGLRRGHVSVVTVESVARGLFPNLLGEFWRRHPNISLDLHIARSKETFDAMVRENYDLAITFDTPVPPKARRLATAALNLGALMRPDHPFASRKQLQLRDFAGERVLLADTSLALGKSVEDAALSVGVEFFQVRANSNSIQTLIDFVMAGFGVTFQTRVGAEREIARGELVFVPVQDRVLKSRKLVLLSRGSGRLPEAPSALAAMLIEAIQGLYAGNSVSDRER